MTPVEKAVWYIESHFAGEIGLDEVARAAGVSHYYIARAFRAVTGWSVMRYIRARRLSEAAKSLAGGSRSISEAAVSAGYNSNEAFTRAFYHQFGTSPETVQTERGLKDIDLVEPMRMSEIPFETIQPPRFEAGKSLLIAGLCERCSRETSAAIPALWQRFHAYFGNIPHQAGNAAYGVLCNGDEDGNIDYVCGAEVSCFDDLPSEFHRVRIPAHRYAVFHHSGHISDMRCVWMTIFSKWFPDSGLEPDDAPEFERYDENFDPKTGFGGFEIWIPVKARA